MTEHLTPLNVCLRLIGPIPAIAEICDVSESTPHHWKRGSKIHDPWDIPSARQMRLLLDYSDAGNCGLTAEHLIRGADLEEIQAILADRTPSLVVNS